MDKGGLVQLFWWFLGAEESLTMLSFEEGFNKLFQKLRRKGGSFRDNAISTSARKRKKKEFGRSIDKK